MASKAKKRKASSAYISKLTKEHAEELGWMLGLVERYDSFSRRKHDLFGFADYIAVSEGGAVLLQVTGSKDGKSSQRGERIRKLCGERKEEVRRCLESGLRVEVWSWEKRDRRWGLVRVPITLEMLDGNS